MDRRLMMKAGPGIQFKMNGAGAASPPPFPILQPTLIGFMVLLLLP